MGQPTKESTALCTYSIGIAIGHIKEPLQDMIEAARAAEHRAKEDLGRNALSITLFKRSGETVEWGCEFGTPGGARSASLELLEFFRADGHYRRALKSTEEPRISGKFPYRLIELLARYQSYGKDHGLPDFRQPEPLKPELREIAEREVEWAIAQQCQRLSTEEKVKFMELCRACLKELEERKRPLSDFYHLFAVEAFIGRQGT